MMNNAQDVLYGFDETEGCKINGRPKNGHRSFPTGGQPIANEVHGNLDSLLLRSLPKCQWWFKAEAWVWEVLINKLESYTSSNCKKPDAEI